MVDGEESVGTFGRNVWNVSHIYINRLIMFR